MTRKKASGTLNLAPAREVCTFFDPIAALRLATRGFPRNLYYHRISCSNSQECSKKPQFLASELMQAANDFLTTEAEHSLWTSTPQPVENHHYALAGSACTLRHRFSE
jgi:hypothetical protein